MASVLELLVVGLCAASPAAASAAPPTEAEALYAQAQQLEAAGDLSDAALKAEGALARWESLPEKPPGSIADCLTFLGDVYRRQKAYVRAESLLERGLSVGVTAFGGIHSGVASTITCLGDLAYDQADWDRAASHYERGLAIRQELFRRARFDDPEEAKSTALLVADSLTRLGHLQLTRKDYAAAQSSYERALTIRERARGASDPVEVTESLSDLAILHELNGQYENAVLLLERALNLRVASFDEIHPLVASSLNSLGALYVRLSRYDEADELLSRALRQYERAWGPQSATVGAILDNLGMLRLKQGREPEAIPLLMRAFAISEGQFRQGSFAMPDSDLERTLRSLEQGQRHLYALARARPEDESIRRLAITAALMFKGRSFEEEVAISRALVREAAPKDRSAYEQLRALRSQFARLSLAGRGQLTPAEYRLRLERLTKERATLESDLFVRLTPSRAALPDPSAIIERVAQALPPDAALVQYVAYRYQPLPAEEHPEHFRYQAFIVLPNGRTSAVDLGDGAAVDGAADATRDALANKDPGFNSPAHEVYRLILKPVLPFIGGLKRIFVVPDGQLALVPFAALPLPSGYVADAYDITYLTSGTDLLPRPDSAVSSSVFVLADPDFRSRSEAPSQLRAALDRSGAWSSLPRSLEEAEAIKQLVPGAQIFTGTEATKARLLGLVSPGVLHIATHGFFLDDLGPNAYGRTIVTSDPPSRADTFASLSDPLLRSGLVLAKSPEGDLADALVTALELTDLNLWGTQLVVLSACDTGRGQVNLGQGVYGLRRALMVAGTETVVASLWKVEDASTRELMELYYRNLLDGQGRGAGLRKAMLALRQKHPHPYYWAPFIVIGRDTPLRGVTASRSR